MTHWLLAIRPKTLWASVGPVMIGSAMAYGQGSFHGPSALAALLGALLIQIGTNLANDYFDGKSGVDGADRKGPVRVTQSGLIEPRMVKWAFIACFGAAALIAFYLVARAGAPVVIIGAASIISGILYTAGPKPLSHSGLGDIFVLVFYGPVATAGTYYVQALEWNPAVVAAGLAPGLLSTAILAVNNLRDIDSDRRAGKRTLAVRYGRMFTRLEYLVCVAGACYVPVGVYLMTHESPFTLLSALIFLFLLPVIHTVFTSEDGRALNEALARTGMALLLFSVIFSIPWIIQAVPLD
jgi:1,4-dihydroxy-2-naphthoate octaprenyltransferase